ncbi:MAG TPA: bifunctional indole-3-glycerol-phosphate synthase TrpC/phosphoribosylanthranilate isomerase TrpF [Allosphingosinicella sp.]|nr:bifunctional indole-3-glycerol-phosphate synthase TrpC/phosphoribosylanthranilate isomerase TrpF [Allosphingosinicella sp.]
MGDVLGAILERKRADLAVRLAGAALADLRARAAPTRRSLRAALAQPGARFIMEVKKASPSAGALSGVAAAAQARAYADVADAISVLTDGPFFGGSLDDLRAVRRVFDGPILAKDFIVDPRQVVEARIAGADAVLAMLSVLDDEGARAVMAEAEALGMDVLVEAHDEAEVRRAVQLGAPLIGINNRDLRTLEVDLATTTRLAPLIPADRIVVAESGIGDRADVERLAPFADAFLVGSALMRAERPAEAVRLLAFGRVKVCGLTNAADLDMAAKAGATHAGLVMVPGTPRAVTLGAAQTLLAGAKLAPRIVGIFRDADPETVNAAARGLGLHAVQLHGSEEVGAFRALLPAETEIWAAVEVGAGTIGPRAGADRVLFDSGRGGTGRAFDWSRVAGRDDLRQGLLAGGLSPANAGRAARLGAFALDVGSGLEALPGWKDSNRTAAFFAALRPLVRGELARC